MEWKEARQGNRRKGREGNIVLKGERNRRERQQEKQIGLKKAKQGKTGMGRKARKHGGSVVVSALESFLSL